MKQRGRALVLELYRAAIHAVAPDSALRRALAGVEMARTPRIIALGKAAAAMAASAVQLLAERGREPAGGVIVAPEQAPPPHPSLRVVRGDHPEPGAGSRDAAARIAEAAAGLAGDDEVWVLLSGGASSLAGAPVDGVTPDDFAALSRLLLGSGLDIAAMNGVRKRVARWGAGRLAAALSPARVRVWAISDVPGDEPATIGSGPCAPDPWTASDVRQLLERAGLWQRVPASVRAYVDAVAAGRAPETPKPGDPAFRRVETAIIARNRTALEGAAAHAVALGARAFVQPEPLSGEAVAVGRRIGRHLLEHGRRCASESTRLAIGTDVSCLLWGGETVVTLGASHGRGGRCQELALAVAEQLHAAEGSAHGVTLLAAGTDGRDGPTDAAGAIVDGETWTAVSRAGRDPAHDLAGHDAYAALDAAGALLRTGLTGTNVMDLVIGVRFGAAG